MNKIMGIYKIENLTKGFVYIGSSKDIIYRFSQHLRELRNNEHFNRFFQNVYNKYGEDSLAFSTLEEVNNERSLLSREKFWILFYRDKDPKKLINSCLDAERGGPPKFYEQKEWLSKYSFEDLVKFYKDGHSIVECARQFGVSRSAAFNAMIDNGITRDSECISKNSWQRKVSKDELISYYLDNHTIIECAKKFGSTEGTILRLFKKWKISRTAAETKVLTGPFSKIDLEALVSYYKQGHSCVDCAIKFKIHKQNVFNYLSSKGLTRTFRQSMELRKTK